MDFALTIKRNSDRVLTLTAYYEVAIPSKGIAAGDPMPLTGRDVVFVAYRDSQDPEGSVQFVKRTGVGNGITVRPAPSDNVADVQVAREDTAGLVDDTTLYCEAQVETADNDLWPLAEGSLHVELAWAGIEEG